LRGGGEKRRGYHSPVFLLFILPTSSTNSRENSYYTDYDYIAVIVFFACLVVCLFWFPFDFESRIRTPFVAERLIAILVNYLFV